MQEKEFKAQIQKAKSKHPKIFDLDSDGIPTIKEIKMLEEYYSIAFPKSYKDFLLQFGGGYFAFIIVYSLDKQSPFYIKDNVTKEFINANDFLPVIDFETGDLAGFKITNGICEDAIMLYNHEEKIMIDLKLDFYDVLVKYGLKIE